MVISTFIVCFCFLVAFLVAVQYLWKYHWLPPFIIYIVKQMCIRDEREIISSIISINFQTKLLGKIQF